MPMIGYRLAFPKLTDDNHVPTSPFDQTYNCIGHAADSQLWWEPLPVLGGNIYWPPDAPREMTVEAYSAAYATLGYVECRDGLYQRGYQKIALFAKGGVPTHAARQLDASFWTSKLGQGEDISHRLDDVSGNIYGEVVKFMRRRDHTTSWFTNVVVLLRERLRYL